MIKGDDVPLFDMEEDWEAHWVGMPEYDNVEETPPLIEATFKFRTQEDFDLFVSHLSVIYNGERIFDGMQRKDVKSTWFPLKEKARKYRYV